MWPLPKRTFSCPYIWVLLDFTSLALMRVQNCRWTISWRWLMELCFLRWILMLCWIPAALLCKISTLVWDQIGSRLISACWAKNQPSDIIMKVTWQQTDKSNLLQSRFRLMELTGVGRQFSKSYHLWVCLQLWFINFVIAETRWSQISN